MTEFTSSSFHRLRREEEGQRDFLRRNLEGKTLQALARSLHPCRSRWGPSSLAVFRVLDSGPKIIREHFGFYFEENAIAHKIHSANDFYFSRLIGGVKNGSQFQEMVYVSGS